MSEQQRVALIAGTTGLIGWHLVRKLLMSPLHSQVISVTRRAINGPNTMISRHHKLRQIITPLDDMEACLADQKVKADDAYCTLGTTIKKAGSQEAFRHVDFDYVVSFARAAKRAGARRFSLVSAAGANAKSSIFYSRVKGEVEDAVSELGFETVQIFRPGMLLEERKESRPFEATARVLMPMINPFLLGGASIYRGIDPERVAMAMVAAASEGVHGRAIYYYNDMMERAQL